ncbi:hypothetical protein EJB05_58101 [Eragrostis curvula]|uniref:Uncharacterized protein n=1 Tax=Eragrostis curvula TaxID=38414 RepID=A0A5J9SCW5_9POAL|nr:hypothetical protein EJB05_58101 [Eragrostis curvula]
MPFTPGPYSGVSTLALVARASAFGVGVVYGTIKLSILKELPIEISIGWDAVVLNQSDEGLGLVLVMLVELEFRATKPKKEEAHAAHH